MALLARVFPVFLLLIGAADGFAGSAGSAPRVKRVVHVVFENADEKDARVQPVFRRLAARGVRFLRSRGVTHPSQPNYIAMVAGSTLGVRTNRRSDLDSRHLGDLLEERKLSWGVYAEDYPGNCFLGMRQGKYVRKHVPFLSFRNVQADPHRCAHIRDGNAFFSDLESGQLPEYAMFVPNLDQDGHDTGPRYASDWFGSRFAGVLDRKEFLKDTLFLVTYDESERWLGENRIFTILFGANVRPGIEIADPVDHYTFLRMIEEIFHLGSLGRGDARARSLPGIWQETDSNGLNGE